MSLATEIVKLREQAALTTVGVQNAFYRKTAEAYLADNALKLGGQSREEMINAVATLLSSHANNKSNPHGVTVDTVGTYSAAVLDQKFASLVPKSILPISQFGDPDTVAQLPLFVTPSTRQVSFGVMPVFIAGGSYTLPGNTFALLENTTYYFYLKLIAGNATIAMSLNKEPESITVMYVGKVRFAGGATAENTIGKVTRIDIYRISKVAAGSAIPVSTGFPGDPGTLAWK